MTPDNINNYFDADGHPQRLPDGTFKETITVLQLLQEAFSDRPPGIDSTISFNDVNQPFRPPPWLV
jgi:hypothetical protein